MDGLYIEHNGKKHKVKEMTIQTWSEIMKNKDLLDETEMFLKTIELLTDIPHDELLKADATEIYVAGEKIMGRLAQERRNVSKIIEHDGTQYEYLDVNDIPFGQFIDIDTFLSKPETYKLSNLNELAAYLYIEKGTKYGDQPFVKRKEKFVDLPMKYLEGGVFFLTSSARVSVILTKIYSQSKWMRRIAKIKIISGLIGDGIQQSVASVRTKFGYLISLLAYPLFSVSTIWLTLWTLIKSKKRNKKK